MYSFVKSNNQLVDVSTKRLNQKMFNSIVYKTDIKYIHN